MKMRLDPTKNENKITRSKYKNMTGFDEMVEWLSEGGSFSELREYFDITICKDKNEITMTRKNKKYTIIETIEITCSRACFELEYGVMSIETTYEDGEKEICQDPEDRIDLKIEQLHTNLAG
jgi:hypothetical protein